MKIYISGKITGMREEDSRALFRCGCSIVECCGHIPINPWTINDRMPTATYEELMHEDLRMVSTEAEAMFMLTNWQTSPGAKREIEAAQAKGIPIYYESDISEFWHRCLIPQAERGGTALEPVEEVEQEEVC